jgi:hypothetical protein
VEFGSRHLAGLFFAALLVRNAQNQVLGALLESAVLPDEFFRFLVDSAHGVEICSKWAWP